MTTDNGVTTRKNGRRYILEVLISVASSEGEPETSVMGPYNCFLVLTTSQCCKFSTILPPAVYVYKSYKFNLMSGGRLVGIMQCSVNDLQSSPSSIQTLCTEAIHARSTFLGHFGMSCQFDQQ